MTLPPFNNKREQRFGGFIIVIVGILILFSSQFIYSTNNFFQIFGFIGIIIGLIGLFYLLDGL